MIESKIERMEMRELNTALPDGSSVQAPLCSEVDSETSQTSIVENRTVGISVNVDAIGRRSGAITRLHPHGPSSFISLLTALRLTNKSTTVVRTEFTVVRYDSNDCDTFAK